MSTFSTKRMEAKTNDFAAEKNCAVKGVADLSPLVSFIDQFTKSVLKLEKTYTTLQEKVDELNQEIAQKNKDLKNQIYETKKLETHLKNILQSMGAGVIALDVEGEIIVFNRAAEKITGLARSQVIGKSYRQVLQNCFRSSKNAYTALMARKEYSGYEDIFFRKRDGKRSIEKPIRRSVSLIRDEKRQIIGSMEILEDISEVKKLQFEIQQASNLAALGEMSRQVAHEIRNPLGGIAGFASLLERDLDPDDPRMRYVKKISEGVVVLDQFVSDLLLFASPLRPNFREADLVELTQRYLSIAQAKYAVKAQNLNLIQRYSEEKVATYVDPQLYQELILHAFYNALLCMPHGGELLVKITKHKNKHSANLEFSIHGKDLNQRAFFVEEPAGENIFSRDNGLVLAIIKRIVETHHGKFQLLQQNEKDIKLKMKFKTVNH